MDLLLKIFLILIIHPAETNDCSLCSCERGLNLVYCFGYEIYRWRKIPNSTWVYDLDFIKTRINALPILDDDDYKKLKNLVIGNVRYCYAPNYICFKIVILI